MIKATKADVLNPESQVWEKVGKLIDALALTSGLQWTGEDYKKEGKAAKVKKTRASRGSRMVMSHGLAEVIYALPVGGRFDITHLYRASGVTLELFRGRMSSWAWKARNDGRTSGHYRITKQGWSVFIHRTS